MYKRKKRQETEKTKKYRYWNNGIEYFCIVKSPIQVPDYRIKEIIDKTFVGKIIDFDCIPSNLFTKLNSEITYEIKPVKGGE